MERVLSRAGIWLVVLFLAISAVAASADWGFAVHMGIVALAAVIGLAVALRGGDYSGSPPFAEDRGKYYDDVIRWGVIATVFWGMAGFAAGLFIALQLAFPALNLDLEWTTFGR
ncbi:MAG: cytochrome-c oxidase, cbb3-type subunit I, partial [Novosphingobium sp.]